MRICMIGKFPPIEGGVSTHQYWCAHALAAQGHEVHVVTNAAEVELPFRMWMRPEDWSRCEGSYSTGGSVSVHRTVYDHRQRHIPAHNPFASKLASIAATVIREHDLELIFSYYLEPYGVAGHLAAEMTGRPHVVKHAGSDVGRLRQHPQLGPLYDHVLRAAARVITGGSVAEEILRSGIHQHRLFLGDDFRLPEDLFTPNGPAMDLKGLFAELAEDPEWGQRLRGRSFPPPPYLGMYCKLGELKGTFDLIRVVAQLRQKGQRISLLLVGSSWEEQERKLTELLTNLNLSEAVTRLPFLPHWRIPEFVRLCQAVCFLERDFPIAFHAPVIPREVFACGRCLIGSATVLRRQLFAERLVHGYNVVAVRDVHDTEELARKVSAVLEDAEATREVGRRAYQFSADTEPARLFPRNYESLFTEVITGRSGATQPIVGQHPGPPDRFPWLRQALERLSPESQNELAPLATAHGVGPVWALAAYAKFLEAVKEGVVDRGVALDSIRLELQAEGVVGQGSSVDPGETLFRLKAGPELVRDDDLNTLHPITAPGLCIEPYDYDVGELVGALGRRELPWLAPRRLSWAATLPKEVSGVKRIASLSEEAIRLLVLCTGARTVYEVAQERCRELNGGPESHKRQVQLILECFRLGLLYLSGPHLPETIPEPRPVAGDKLQ